MSQVQKIITTLVFTVLYSPFFAQNKSEGVISYTMDLQAPPIFEQLSQHSQSSLPSVVHHKVNVYFKDTWIKYEDTTLVMKQKKATEVAYKNSEAGWFINKSDGLWYLLHQLDGKVYYAEEPLKSQQWRFTVSLYDASPDITTKFQRQIYKINDAKMLQFTDETKTILGYKCKKALYKSGTTQLDGIPNNDDMVIWYTEELPQSVGPVPCNLLNGAILEINLHRIHYVATAVNLKPIDKSLIALPQDGIKMTVYTEEQMIDRYMLKRN